jgi:hypothetical protein
MRRWVCSHALRQLAMVRLCSFRRNSFMSAKKIGTSVAFITGANSGIGKDAARQLALTGRYSKVLIGSRDKGLAVQIVLKVYF